MANMSLSSGGVFRRADILNGLRGRERRAIKRYRQARGTGNRLAESMCLTGIQKEIKAMGETPTNF